jgi:hypothetical protein
MYESMDLLEREFWIAAVAEIISQLECCSEFKATGLYTFIVVIFYMVLFFLFHLFFFWS